MLINVKMPTIVGILTFMSMINFMLSGVEHKKSFIISGQVFCGMLATMSCSNEPTQLQRLSSSARILKVCLKPALILHFEVGEKQKC